MRRAIIGVDPSSKKIALTMSLGGAKIRVMAKVLPKDDLPMACLTSFRYMRKTVKTLVEAGYEVFVFIEDPVLGRAGGHATIVQSQTRGAMLAGAKSAGAQVHGANNSSWKKRVVGNGRASKPEIKKWVRNQWPYLYELSQGDQDIIDSGCIWRYGQQVLETKDKIEELKNAPKPTRRRVVHRR